MLREVATSSTLLSMLVPCKQSSKGHGEQGCRHCFPATAGLARLASPLALWSLPEAKALSADSSDGPACLPLAHLSACLPARLQHHLWQSAHEICLLRPDLRLTLLRSSGRKVLLQAERQRLLAYLPCSGSDCWRAR